MTSNDVTICILTSLIAGYSIVCVIVCFWLTYKRNIKARVSVPILGESTGDKRSTTGDLRRDNRLLSNFNDGIPTLHRDLRLHDTVLVAATTDTGKLIVLEVLPPVRAQNESTQQEGVSCTEGHCEDQGLSDDEMRASLDLVLRYRDELKSCEDQCWQKFGAGRASFPNRKICEENDPREGRHYDTHAVSDLCRECAARSNFFKWI